ncbi:MAG TPA: pyrimidine 5'-nucleotidase [Beijerinckiaceae bacterium]|nr:pyrimidine 5'-nucleotidase [Beijerinckiaceae bacterium]
MPAFGHIDTWVFDLDNTLYPPHADLWPKVDAKITAYLADMFGIDGLSARALQKHYYQRYGTTLNGLMNEHSDALDIHHFLDFVHDIDRSSIAVDDALAAAIERLPGRRLVFTNGSRGHAEKTMIALGIAHLFDDVFDIVAGSLIPKPKAETYERFLAAHEVEPKRAVMFEDIARNLEVPKLLGMATVLVVPKAGGGDHRDEVDVVRCAPTYVDHVTDDLAAFLGRVLAR